MPNRLAGVLLFLPVPLVLFLFTRAPLGILPSLAAGVVLMLTHRLYARPWALARSRARCVWCGADIAAETPAAPTLVIEDPLGRAWWWACSEAHARSETAVVAWAKGHSGFLKVGIIGAVVVFLAWGLGAGMGWLSTESFGHAVAFFRVAVATTVLTLAWLAPRAEPEALESVVRCPFPVHLSALVGLRFVLWLFRLIGVLWLVLEVLHMVERAAS